MADERGDKMMTTDEVCAWLADNAAKGKKPASANQLALLCGVGRAFMSLVLHGKRHSAPLLAKIDAVKSAQERRSLRRKEARHAKRVATIDGGSPGGQHAAGVPSQPEEETP